MRDRPKILLSPVGALAAYPVAYLHSMGREQRAYEPATGRWFPSSCRLSPSVRIPGDLTIYGRSAGPLNFLYLPLDRLGGKDITYP